MPSEWYRYKKKIKSIYSALRSIRSDKTYQMKSVNEAKQATNVFECFGMFRPPFFQSLLHDLIRQNVAEEIA